MYQIISPNFILNLSSYLNIISFYDIHIKNHLKSTIEIVCMAYFIFEYTYDRIYMYLSFYSVKL